MNEMKKRTKINFVNPNDAKNVVDKMDSTDSLYVLHELHYPDTRKDICLVKKTFVQIEGSFDVLYLVWKNGTNVITEKICSTSIYDPPNEQHLAVGYFLEENNKILVKIYFSVDLNRGGNRKFENVYSMNKEKLGLK